MLTFLVACILIVLTLPLWVVLLALLSRAIAFLVPLACLGFFLIYFAG